jgi:hypothetical protein
MYLAVPVHQSVLLSPEAQQAVTSGCATDNLLCQGLKAFFPFLQQSYVWIKPIIPYGVVSLLVFVVLLGIGVLKTGQWRIRLSFSPLTIILCFIASLWLMFTVISTGKNGDMPFTRIFAPSAQVYQNIDPQSLQALGDNFQQLLDAGCLTPIVGSNPPMFDMKHKCIQGAFFTRVLSQVFMVLALIFVMLTLGRFILQRLRTPAHHGLAELTFSAGFGACGVIFVLWLLALIGSYIHQPIYSQAAGWAILIAIPAALYKHARYWLESLVRKRWTYDEVAYGGALIIGWLLISYLAINFLNVVRPFPIGWDDLGKYLNQPRMMVSYGYMIPQLAVYQWEYITSLGFMLFGFDSVFGATASMMFNWLGGLLAVLSVYAFGRLYLGPKQGLLAALLYYVLPLVGHFSFADMKVDNAVFAMGAMTALAVFLALFPAADELGDSGEETDAIKETVSRNAVKWIIAAGVLGGFAFSIKVTSIMTLMALGTMLFGAALHWSGFLGTASIAMALFTLQNRLDIKNIATRVYGSPEAIGKSVILVAFLLIGGILTAYAMYLKPRAIKRTFILAGVFIASFAVTILPWLINNNIASGNVIPRLVFGAPNNLSPNIVIGQEEVTGDGDQVVRQLPPELRVDTSKCVGTAREEELDRYWGFGSGWRHYLTLPWRTVMNVDSAGYYVTTFPALLFFPLLLLLPFFWMKPARWLRWLSIATGFMLLQWMFFANGIPWYGLGTFLGLVIALEAMIFRAPDIPGKTAASLLIGLSIVTAFSQRMWQFDQQKNLFEYALGKVSYEAMRERTIPHYDNIREISQARAEQNPERPYIFRIGTFIPYFIPRNLEVMPLADHQLEFFNCIYQERDAELTLKRMQALGFNSIVFDTNTHTIERDPNGSLHKKVQSFVDFVNSPVLKLQLAVNDPDGGIAYILLPDVSASTGATIGN